MPDLKISQMPAADALAGTEALPVVQGGENKHSTPAAIKTYLGDAAPTGANQNDGLMTHEDKAKLDGIEAKADVTDATNVAAAGAVMAADVDDVPVDGATTAPISSNWAFDHAANLNAHGISDFGETLIDDDNAATARGTLGLGDSATKNVGTTSGTVAAGNDSRLSDARTPTAHKTSHATGGSDALTAADIGAAATGHDHAGVYQPADSDLDALAGLSTTGLIERTGAGTAGIVTVTAAGKALLDDADAAAQIATLGAATAAQGGKADTALQPAHIDTDSATTALHHTLGTGANQAAAGNHAHSGVYEPADATILKQANIVNTLDSTSNTAPLSAAQGKALNDAKLNTTGGILGTYAETGATLTPVAGALTIPLDGKTYAVTITAAITSITTTAPTAPNVGSAVVYFQQDGTGGYAVSIPATWYWADGVITPIATAANAKTRLTLVTSPSGNVHADAEVRSVPA